MNFHRPLLLAMILPLSALLSEQWMSLACAADPATKKSTRAANIAKNGAESDKSKKTSQLRMSRAVVCRSIDGFEQYVPLGDAGLTSDEKLLVYYRPDGYKFGQNGQDRFVHFSQDGKIRRRGETRPVRTKSRLLDIKSEGKNPPPQIFLRNTVSLKDLPPGEYEYDILLRDENAPGESAAQTISFRIVRADSVRSKPEAEPMENSGSRKASKKPKE